MAREKEKGGEGLGKDLEKDSARAIPTVVTARARARDQWIFLPEARVSE